MMHKSALFAFACILLFMACKSTKSVSSMPQNDISFENRTSILNIPLKVSVEELEKTINQQTKEVLYEDNSFEDGDDLMIRAQKKEDISIELDSQLIKYRVPLDLWIKYDVGLGKVEAEGSIALNFKTAFDIKEDWTLETQTELVEHEWLEKPKLRLGVVSLPVGLIGDIVLKNSSEIMTKTIDDMARENLKLDEMVAETWKQLYDPMLVSEEYNAWLTVNPKSIGMTPLLVDNNMINSTIVIESKPEVKMGEEPKKGTPAPLPPFRYREQPPEEFIINLNTEISYLQAEQIAQDQMLGETFEYGKRSITIEDIAIRGEGNQIMVDMKVSGTYEGNMFMTGKPSYNAKKNTIDIKDLKYTLPTKNVLLKSAAWLLKGTIKKRIQENLNFLMDYNLQEIEKQIQDQLTNYKVTDNVMLNGQLSELNIRNAYLVADGIRVEVALRGKISAQMNSFIDEADGK